MKMIRAGMPIRVDWVDPGIDPDWKPHGAAPIPPPPCRSRGVVTRTPKGFIVLAMTTSAYGTAERLSIPRGCIVDWIEIP